MQAIQVRLPVANDVMFAVGELQVQLFKVVDQTKDELVQVHPD